MSEFDDFLEQKTAWARKQFGSGKRTLGILKHIRKECDEVEADPTDLKEWVDIILLAIDGFCRHGGTPQTLLPALWAKLHENMKREWPKNMSEDMPVEHIRPGGSNDRS